MAHFEGKTIILCQIREAFTVSKWKAFGIDLNKSLCQNWWYKTSCKVLPNIITHPFNFGKKHEPHVRFVNHDDRLDSGTPRFSTHFVHCLLGYVCCT